MERSSYRDHVLLGYSPRKSFGSPKFTGRTSDVDFHDVFGGPPRRSSINDWRHSLSETTDSISPRGEEETVSYRNPWSGLSEKPVFGEETQNRRRYPSDDFFDDIFKGDESSSSTPVKPGSDIFSSTPISRVLSPTHPLPPQSEPFGSSSLPPLLSLTTKQAKEMDFPASTSPSRSPYKSKQSASTGIGCPSSPRPSMTRSLTQVVQGQDGSRNDARSFYRQSPLSHEFSLSSKGSPKATESDKQGFEGLWKKDSSSSEVNNNGNQFHFSIYKWACKGVPLVMPLRGGNSSSSKEKFKPERPVSELPVPVLQGVAAASKSFWWESENEEDTNLVFTPTKKDGMDSPKFIDEVPAKPEKPLNNFQSTITDVPGCNLPQNSGEEIKPGSAISCAAMEISLCEGREKDVPVSKHEAHKPELKPVRCLFKDDSGTQENSDTQENDKQVEKARMNEGTVKIMDTLSADVDSRQKVKKHAGGKRNTSNLADVTNSSFQDSRMHSGEKLVSNNRIKGKVKEFVKIFNQEVPSKPTANAETRGQRTGVKDTGACKADYQANVCATKADGNEVTNMKNNRKLTDTPVVVDQVLKQSVKPQSESIPKSFETEVDTIEDSHGEDFSCMVEEVCHDQNNQPETSRHNEELQVSDAKIRQWSNGKEGNIRSLLSTLQYVLWPDSGWKPVPLVDIIEGNSVKRAYQKALLCLHPDKLQQKGAAPHQKYIAGKVFDILQESWTHFNSLC